MAHPALVAAVEERLAANWSDTPIIGANTAGVTPSDGSAYVLVDYPTSTTTRMPISDRMYQEEGGFRIVLHSERGIGLANGLAQAEELAAIFRDQKFGDGLAVNTLAPDSPIIDDRNEEGMYLLFITVVPYTFQYRA